MLAAYLQRRGPAMIVLSYGTNEASDPLWHRESYGAAFAKVVERLRGAAPAATILVLGPADRWMRARGRWQLVPGIDDIIAQQGVCREIGCVYWDTRQRMGGVGTMHGPNLACLPPRDRVHLTARGARPMTPIMFADLMHLFEASKKARLETSDPI